MTCSIQLISIAVFLLTPTCDYLHLCNCVETAKVTYQIINQSMNSRIFVLYQKETNRNLIKLIILNYLQNHRRSVPSEFPSNLRIVQYPIQR